MAARKPVQRHDGIPQQTVVTAAPVTFHKPEEKAAAVLVLVFAFKQSVKSLEPHQGGFCLIGDAEKRVQVQCVEVAPYHLEAE